MKNNDINLEIKRLMDETGRRLLQELQQDARISCSELGKRLGLSSPAVADRMRRMQEAGIITGYHAEVDVSRLGLPIQAIVRLAAIVGQSSDVAASKISDIPEVLECYRLTGSDSLMVKVVAASVDHLAEIIDRLSPYGIPSTSIIRSKPMKRTTIPRKLLS